MFEAFREMVAALDGRPIPEGVHVVFTAGDLGVAKQTNRDVLLAAERGPVREVSLCATGDALAEGAAEALRMSPDVGVGFHLSLTLGRAVTGAIPHLTRVDGTFLPLRDVRANCIRRRPDPRLVAAEIDAQLDALRQLGVAPTHMNGHDFVHVLPVVRDAVLKIVRQHQIRYVRVPRESAFVGDWRSPRRWFLAQQSAAFVRQAKQRGNGFSSLPFVGVAAATGANYRERFFRTATRLAAPAQEWLVRVGREEELSVLTCVDMARALSDLGIESRRFAEVPFGASIACDERQCEMATS